MTRSPLRSAMFSFAAAAAPLLVASVGAPGPFALAQSTPGQQTTPALPGVATPRASDATQAQAPRLQAPSSVALSPDGTLLAWTVRSRSGSVLHLTSVADPTHDQLLASASTTPCSSGSPVWSPDSQTLAFSSTCTGDTAHAAQEQIFLFSRSDHQTHQLTHLTGLFQQAAWSADGKSLAFLFVENATRSAGALDAMKPFAGVIGEDNVEVQRVYAVDATSGTGGWLSPANLHVYEFNWSPKAQEIAMIAAPPPGENNWWVTKLFRTSAATPGTPASPTVVLDPGTTPTALHGLQIAVPRWSPDGTRIALIGGLMSDQGSTGGDLWVVPASGGNPVDVTPGIDGTPCYESWVNDNTLGFVEDRRGHTLLASWNVQTKKLVGSLDLGENSVSGGPIKDAISYSPATATSAFVRSGLSGPPEIFLQTGRDVKPFTHLNDAVPQTNTAKTISVEWENEGFHVQGWLTYPENFNPAQKYPLIVTVHGGPSASSGPLASTQWAHLGYFEFRPNPRGSFGQGEAFTAANRKDFGYGDLRDILKGMDMLESKYPIDKAREGLTGWSYGGFMTMFAVTQTHRFRAAVAGAGLSDWLSYYGENSIDQWMIPFFGASVYDDPAVYAKSSAITFIKKVTTPTLVIVGDRDGECPAPQSFEFWHALRDLGVKTELVVYPNEGHGFRNPDHIRDRAEREAKWFADNMPAANSQNQANKAEE